MGGCPLIRICSLIRSNTVRTIYYHLCLACEFRFGPAGHLYPLCRASADVAVPVSLRVHRRRRGHRPVGVVAPAVGRRRHLAADAGTSASGGADAALHGPAAGRAHPPAEEDGGSRRARRRVQGTPTRFYHYQLLFRISSWRTSRSFAASPVLICPGTLSTSRWITDLQTGQLDYFGKDNAILMLLNRG